LIREVSPFRSLTCRERYGLVSPIIIAAVASFRGNNADPQQVRGNFKRAGTVFLRPDIPTENAPTRQVDLVASGRELQGCNCGWAIRLIIHSGQTGETANDADEIARDHPAVRDVKIIDCGFTLSFCDLDFVLVSDTAREVGNDVDLLIVTVPAAIIGSCDLNFEPLRVRRFSMQMLPFELTAWT